MPFAHVPAAARRLVLDRARAFRVGAAIRVRSGGSVGDDAYGDAIHDAAAETAEEIRRITCMHVPPRSVRLFLWRAAHVGEKYAHRN